MNLKGNAIAIVLVAAVVTAIVVVTLQNTPPVNINNQANSTEKLMSEFENSIDKGFKNSTNEIMGGGFSADNPVWFYNEPTIPSLSEFDMNLTSLAKSDIEELLKELKAKTGYDYDPASLKVELNVPVDGSKKPIDQIKGLPEDGTIELEINVLAVVNEGGQQKQVMYSKKKKVSSDAIKMYKKLAEWMETDMKYFDAETARTMDEAGYCQVALCDCTSFPEPTKDGKPLNLIDGNLLTADKYNLENIRPKYEKLLQAKIDKLNKQFTGTGITCTYQIEDWDTRTLESREQECVKPNSNQDLPSPGSLQRHCKEPGGRWQNIKINDTLTGVEFDEMHYELKTDGSSIPAPRSIEGEIEGFLYFQWQDKKLKDAVPSREKVLDSTGLIGPMRLTNPQLKTAFCATETVKDHKDEKLSLNPQLYAKVAIKCTNPQAVTGAGAQAEAATSTIKLVTALEKACPSKALTPNPPLTQEPPKCLGAASAPIVECILDIDCIPMVLRDPKIVESGKGGICTKFWCEKNPDELKKMMETTSLTEEQLKALIAQSKGLCKQADLGLEVSKCPGQNACNRASCAYMDDKGNLYPEATCKINPIKCQGPSTNPTTCGAPYKCDEAKGCMLDLAAEYSDCTKIPELQKGDCIKAVCNSKYECVSQAKTDLCPLTADGTPQYCDQATGLCREQTPS